MKILVVNGSPKSDGATAKLLEALDLPEQSDYIDCFKKLPLPCMDCGFCKEEFSCALKDLEKEYELIEQADIIIFAFPVYNMSLPSPLKALVERFQKYFNAHFALGIKQPVEKPKKIGIIISSGSDDEFSKTVCVSQIKQAFSVMNGEVECVHWQKNTDIKPIIDSDFELLRRKFNSIFEN